MQKNKENKPVAKDPIYFTDKYMDNFGKKKYTTSKIQLILTAIIFIIILLFVGYMYFSGRIDTVYDTAALVTMISVSGAIFGSNLCWYSKKSAGENHFKLRMALYHDSARVRLHYNESMMILMKKYGFNQDDINNIDDSGEMDEMMSSALDSVVCELDEIRDDADSKNEIENFG